MKKNILIISNMFPNKINPIAGIFILEQLKQLKKEYNFKVICPLPWAPKWKFLNPYYKYAQIPKRDIFDGIEVFYPRYLAFPKTFFISQKGFFFYLGSRKLINEIYKNWSFHLVHLHSAYPSGYLTNYIKKKHKTPCIITTHGSEIRILAKKNTTVRSLIRRDLQNSDKVICVSNNLKEELINIGISKNKISLIPNGFDRDKFRIIAKEETRKKLGLPQTGKIVLNIGLLVPVKGQKYLLQAFKNVLAREKNIRLLIIGSGPLKKELTLLSKKLGIENNINFLGPKPHNEIPLWINACDLFVLSSLSEGFPTVIPEAFACGKPVVASKVGGIPEIIKDKKLGYLVEPRDIDNLSIKILDALNKDWDQEYIVKQAQQYSWQDISKKTFNIYKSLL